MTLKNGVSLSIAGLICLLAGMAQKPSESQAIAQGEYSVLQNGQKADAGRTVDQWSLYRLPDGTFKVDVEIKTVSAPDKAVEHRTFSKAMTPSTYEWVMQKKDKTEPATIRCEFSDSEAQCTGKTMNGRPFSTSIAVKAPYTFAPVTDAAIFDFPWLIQSMVWQTKRSVNETTSISVITLMGGENKIGADTENGTVLTTVPQAPPGPFRYLGRETIEIAGQKVDAHKFEVKGTESEEEVMLLWFSDSGLLLKTAGPGTILLSSYHGPAL